MGQVLLTFLFRCVGVFCLPLALSPKGSAAYATYFMFWRHGWPSVALPTGQIADSIAPSQTPSVLTTNPKNLDFSALQEWTRARCLLIMKDGELIHEFHRDPGTKSQARNAFSLSKTVLAVLICQAAQRGFFALDDPIQHSLVAHGGSLTWRQGLRMRAGLSYTEAFRGPWQDLGRVIFGGHMETALRSIFARPRHPDTGFAYQSPVSLLMARALEQETGRSLGSLCEEWIWQPLNMKHSATWLRDQSGEWPMASCCLFAAPIDWLRFGEALRTRALTLSDADWDAIQVGKGAGDPYGFHTWLRRRTLFDDSLESQFESHGVGDQTLAMYPSRGLTVLLLTNRWRPKCGKEDVLDQALVAAGLLPPAKSIERLAP